MPLEKETYKAYKIGNSLKFKLKFDFGRLVGWFI